MPKPKCWYLDADDRLTLNHKGTRFACLGHRMKFRYLYDQGKLVYEPTSYEIKIKRKREEDWVNDIQIAGAIRTYVDGNIPIEILLPEGPVYASLQDDKVTALISQDASPFYIHWPAIPWKELVVTELRKYGEPYAGYIKEQQFIKTRSL